MSTSQPAISGGMKPGVFASAFDYLVDTGQREQFFMLPLEPEASLAAIPKLLPASEDHVVRVWR
jgi:hypothetical protein